MAPYKPTDSELEMALDKLSIFEGMLGYPANVKGLTVAATLFCGIVHFKAASEIMPEPHESLAGVTNDADWLVREMFERYDRFQTMQKFREVYREGGLTPRYRREDPRT